MPPASASASASPLFAATILLLDYFGRGPYLELFSTVNLIAHRRRGGAHLRGLCPATRPAAFTPFFVGLAVLVALVTCWRWS